mgnify:CR=1 FL=1
MERYDFRINAEIAELRSMKMYPGMMFNDGMPHGSGGQGDLSGYAADLDEMILKLQHERYLRIKTYQQIVRQIKKLRSENEKDILFYRYITGLDWWEIAEKMSYHPARILGLNKGVIEEGYINFMEEHLHILNYQKSS